MATHDSRLLHILNPSQRCRDDVKEALPLLGPDKYVWVQHEHPYHAETILRWGLQEGFQNFVVWGGDGTFHRLAQSFEELNLWERASLGLVPVGSCNDLARHLGLRPGDIKSALQGLKSARPARMDIGKVAWQDPESQERRSRVFTNNAGFGRSPRAIREKWGPLRNVSHFQGHSLLLQADGQNQQGEFLLGVICNGPFFNGGLKFASDTSSSDGRLDAFFVRRSSRIRLLAQLAMGRLGVPLMNSEVVRLNGKAIVVESQDNLWLQADGETLDMTGNRRFEFTLMPGKLSLFMPERDPG